MTDRDAPSCWQLEIVIHHPGCDDKQAKYLVRCTDDVLWTDDPEAVIACIREELARIKDGVLGEWQPWVR